MKKNSSNQDLENRVKELERMIVDLKNTNDLLENIFINIPVGLQIFDKDGISQKINLKQKELLGIPNLEEGIGKFNVLTDPYSKANGADILYRKAYKGEVVNQEHEYNFDVPDNQWQTRKGKRYFQETIFPLFNSSKDVTGVVAILADTTEKKDIEKKLQNSELELKRQNNELKDFNDEFTQITLTLQENLTALQLLKDQAEEKEIKFRTLFNSSPDPLFIVEKVTGIIIDLNDKSVEKYGYSPDELIGRPNTIVSAEPEKTSEFAKNPGDFVPIRYHKKKNGEIFPVEISTSNIKINGQEYFFSTIRDITERIKAEQILRESEQRFRGIFDNAISGIAFTDNNQNIIFTNQALDKMLGYEKGELEGVNIDNLLHPDDIPLSTKYITEQMLKNSGIRVERRYLTKQNKPIWVDISGSIINDKEGNPKFFVGVVNDITDKKNAEDKLKELVATKDRFFSIIAHDLKSPFNAILGMSNLLVENIENNNTEQVLEYSQIINSASKQAFTLLENLLDWARSQNGSIQFKPITIDFQDLLNETLLLTENSANQKNINIKQAIEPYLKVHADRNMLSTVIRNLISNSIKYSNFDGEIFIKAISYKKMLQFSISDNGIGISKEDINKLFKIDGHVQFNGTNNEKGTGLGLILCKDFIDKHNGEIWVESELNKGTTFYFTIPKV